MFLLFFYLFIALFISFLCSIMESVLLSTSNSYLTVVKEKGEDWAAKFIELRNNIDKPLSAILSLNTVAHTVGAAGVGAQAIIVFGDAYFGLVSAILTLLILVFTEIIPKTVGAKYYRGLSKFSYYVISVMIVITYPLVLMSAFISKLFSGKEKEKSTSREEVSALATIGANEGIFNEKENKIIQNIIRLKDIKVTDVLTPRVVLALADENLSLEDFLQNKEYLKFSRIPVFSGRTDNVTGYVFSKEVYQNIAEKKQTKILKDIKRRIVVISDDEVLFNVWELLLEEKEHIALVMDEYGNIDGIITLEDIIETLIGLEIIDEKDTITDMQEFARNRWKQRQVKYNYLNTSEKNKSK
jgi:CBS domain containing-hemolysin-like protein